MITFQPGTDTKNRASFLCGKAAIPAAMVSRLLKELKGQSEFAQTRIFFSKLGLRHADFLEAMEKAQISCQAAIQQMIALAPVKEKATPRISKEASAVAKMLCRKYANKGAVEMFAAFAETVNRPEFKALVVELIEGSEKKFGKNAQGRIRVRPERKDLAGNAAKARAGRKKK